MSIDHIAVAGAGAWGTALANALGRAGRRVTLWGRDGAAIEAMRSRRECPRLPGLRLHEAVTPTADVEAATSAEALLLAIPSQQLRAVALLLGPLLAAGAPVIACAKGIEQGSGLFMTDVIMQAIPQARPAILSGPSFAADVARGLPTAVTLAARDKALARTLVEAFGSTTFRPYHASDMRGVEIGGAAKNVLAIAAGIVAGRRLGASAAAALITRGFAELARFGRALGAQTETLTGLSGLGDLVLTCSSAKSRNFSLGVALGEGLDPAAADTIGLLAEGVFTAPVLVEMARARTIDMPIAAAVDAVLAGRLGIDDAIESLLTRPFRAET